MPLPRTSLAVWGLVPASAVFAVRGLVEAAGRDAGALPALGPLTGAVGALALVALVLALAGARELASPHARNVVAAVVAVAVGHGGLPRAAEAVPAMEPWAGTLGPALVYAGQALVVLEPAGDRWRGAVMGAAAVAVVGALARGAVPRVGAVLVAAGAGALAVAAAWAGERVRRGADLTRTR